MDFSAEADSPTDLKVSVKPYGTPFSDTELSRPQRFSQLVSNSGFISVLITNLRRCIVFKLILFGFNFSVFAGDPDSDWFFFFFVTGRNDFRFELWVLLLLMCFNRFKMKSVTNYVRFPQNHSSIHISWTILIFWPLCYQLHPHSALLSTTFSWNSPYPTLSTSQPHSAFIQKRSSCILFCYFSELSVL